MSYSNCKFIAEDDFTCWNCDAEIPEDTEFYSLDDPAYKFCCIDCLEEDMFDRRQDEAYHAAAYGEDISFADPGGDSALRAATPSNPRNLPCPNCGRENMLTPADRQLGYQCDICADALERGGY